MNESICKCSIQNILMSFSCKQTIRIEQPVL